MQRALDREYDVVRREWRAVVKLDAGSKLEAPALGLELLPRDRERGLHREVAVAKDQRLVDLADDASLVLQRQRVRIQRLRIEPAGEAQRFRREGQCGQASGNEHHADRGRRRTAGKGRESSDAPRSLRHMISKYLFNSQSVTASSDCRHSHSRVAAK